MAQPANQLRRRGTGPPASAAWGTSHILVVACSCTPNNSATTTDEGDDLALRIRLYLRHTPQVSL